MKRTSGRIGVGLVLVSLLVGACLTERENSDASMMAAARPEAALQDGREAKDVVLAVRSQLERAFGTTNLRVPVANTPRFAAQSFDLVGTTANIANADMVVMNVDLLAKSDFKANVVLAVRADGAFRLQDERSGLSIEVGLLGATTSAREDVDGYSVYRAGYANGAHLLHHTTDHGTEDYVFFPEVLPATPELRYEVALGESVAGLRLIGRTIEVVDSAGAPRLRMAPPYAVDGDGRRLAVNVAIEGCAYDANIALPWEHAPVDPGSRHCTLHLSWDPAAKAPLVVDPEWRQTANMNQVRMNASVSVLPDGKVLVAGGDTGPTTNSLNTAEVYNPKMDVWTPTDLMKKFRAHHQAVVVADSVILLGGAAPLQGAKAVNFVERYNPQTNMWTNDATTSPYMGTARAKFSATLIPGKGIIVAGGHDNLEVALASTEYLALALPLAWDGGGNMSVPRFGHTATLLDNGKVLVVGGVGANGSPNSAEIFMPEAPWAAAGTMASGHAFHQAVKLLDGKVVVAGGFAAQGDMAPPISAVDVFDPATNAWQSAMPMNQQRAFFAATHFAGTSTVVAMGGITPGVNGDKSTNTVEIFYPAANEWKPFPSMLHARSHFGAALLPNGNILAAGGVLAAAGTLPPAELLACTKDDDCEDGTYCAVNQTCKPRKADGQSCDADAVKDCKVDGCRFCESGFCTDGVCCNKPCKGQCETCDGSVVGAPIGECAPVFGPPVGNIFEKREPCTDHEVCGGACNGVNTEACTYPSGNACETTCTAASNKFESLGCDGSGACKTVIFSQQCSPFLCDEKSKQCTTGCTPAMNGMLQTGCDNDTSVCNTDGQCVPAPTSCIDQNNMKLTDGTSKPCGNFRCVGVACLNVCNTAYDCFLPPSATPEQTVVCDDSRQCILVDKMDPGGDDGSADCSISPSHESSRFGWLAALAIAGAVAARRNRARA